MRVYKFEEISEEIINSLCTRNTIFSDKIINIVDKIEKRIINDGDTALKELSKEIDSIDIDALEISEKEFKKAEKLIDDELKTAIKTAKENIWQFHSSQLSTKKENKIQTTEGINCWREFRAIDKVGLYIPGGTAPLFSTVLMLAIPAIIAGCKEIIICTPPRNDLKDIAEIIWTAKLLDIDKIYKIGGAQAIFAMAYGTETIKKVYKIFGPGNSYVTAAKAKVSSFVSIDMPAGPSEVLVIADKNSNAEFIAADLLSQAEHGEDSQAVLLCTDENKLNEINVELEKQLNKLPRKSIAKKALENSFAILMPNIETAIDFSNLYAPEHLILPQDNFENYLSKIQNAGSVFCGKYTPESLGDYASGTNHTLPTSGFSKSRAGLCTNDFGKWITFQKATKSGLKNIAKTVETMAEREGLFAHKNAVTIRT